MPRVPLTAGAWEIPNPERFTKWGFSSDDPADLEKELEQWHRAVDLAVFLGARSIRVVAGNDDPKTLDKMVPWLQRGMEYAAERNIYACFENHNANAWKGCGGQSCSSGQGWFSEPKVWTSCRK